MTTANRSGKETEDVARPAQRCQETLPMALNSGSRCASMTDNNRSPEIKGEKVLVVEDSPTQAEQLRYMLEKHHYHVSVARNGCEALAMIGEVQPSLIISDIIMPEMDGYELCRRIKNHDEDCKIRIVLLTSLSDPLDVIHGLECGADKFITKPYDEAFLVSRIGHLMENRYETQDCTALPELKITLAGKEFAITSSRHQILDLLLSTYEAAIHKNNELAQARDKLNNLNEQLEKRVEERTAELREKDQILLLQSRQAAMGEMIGNIAHQWRQPLNTLGLYIQRLELFYGSGSLTKELLTTTTSESMRVINHMSRTIDDFRHYFREDKEMSEFNAHGAIKNTLSLLEGSLQNPKISVEIVAKDDPVIYGYQNEFAQVLLNILINARDALIEKEINNPRVTITISSEDGCTVLNVADNAGGIPEEILDKIFDPYFTTKDPERGTGVGLFMSKAIIEKNMGGQLTVRNLEDGAEFRIEVGNGIPN